MRTMIAMLASLVLVQPPIVVSTLNELRQAAASAGPGTTILVAPGDYVGGVFLSNLHGAEGRPIVIAARDPKNPPRFIGGAGVQLSKITHVHLRDLRIQNVTANGLNIDDGGAITKPSRHVVLERITVTDTPSGNNDGIKLSGLRNFRVSGCTVQRWGGSGIDMVGCQEGLIEDCVFQRGGDSGVQAKGGSSEIVVRTSRFMDYGQRGVNIGGSTGVAFFRPPIDQMPKNGRYEARDIRVEGCTFVGGVAPIAYVGADGARVRFNTIYTPTRWTIRILQETRLEGFVPCRNGVFEDNLVIFKTSGWASGGVNVGDATAPQTFRFTRNFWYCADDPSRSTPTLPTPETGGTYGLDPQATLDAEGRVTVSPTSPARDVGAHAFRP